MKSEFSLFTQTTIQTGCLIKNYFREILPRWLKCAQRRNFVEIFANCRETKVGLFLSSLPGSSCCLNIWLKVQSSWQRFIVHSIYLQYDNIHTIVQVQYLQCRVLSPNSKYKVFFNLNCQCSSYTAIYWYQTIRVPHCYWMQHALGMTGSPIDECNMVQTSLDALDLFDLCLVINGRLKKT